MMNLLRVRAEERPLPCSGEYSVTHGESDVETLGFTDGYPAHYISVQRLTEPQRTAAGTAGAIQVPVPATLRGRRL